MKSILGVEGVVKLSQSLKSAGKSIVLVGGCFDILHYGHIRFLEQAKKHAQVLIVLLEGDEFIKKTKGASRPLNPQKVRAKMLWALKPVDFVICLPFMKSNLEYDNLVQDIGPDIIATTKPDPNIAHKKRVAALSGAKLIFATQAIDNYSTSKYID
jgi:FAD synthetase